jgi:hypothetical protein
MEVGLWPKKYWIKLSCYWERLEEHLGSNQNTLETLKKIKMPPSSKTQKKKLQPPLVHAEPSCWLHKIFISKTLCPHFQPKLIPSL